MAVEQLPARVREFANYLNGLLARLDQGAGWCAVFWQRDPEGMQACLDGREMPPWDVVEALLQDLAAEHGPEVAAHEKERARPLHAAALFAYDTRPGGRDALGDRLDVMLREQRYAAERLAELGRLLPTAASQEDADAIRLDLAWARDDHDRATARCAELRSRMAELDRNSVGGQVRDAHLVRPRSAGERQERERGHGPVRRTEGGSYDAHGSGGGAYGSQGAPGSEGAALGPGPDEGNLAAPRPGIDDSTAPSPGAPAQPATFAPAPNPAREARQRSAYDRAWGRGGSEPAAHDPAWAHEGSQRAAHDPALVREARQRSAHDQARAVREGSQSAAHDPALAREARQRTAHDPAPAPPPEAPHPAVSDDPTPAPAPAPDTPRPTPKQRKRRRGGARFAGMVEEEAAPTVVPPGAVPVLPAPAPTTRRTLRGARFAGAAEEPAGRSEAQVEPVDGAARPEVAGMVETLVRLRGEGRTGEAHVLLIEATYWPAARFPLLAAEMERAGLGADWATLLWEAASLPAEQLVAAADALVAAGRDADGEQILRQGVGRPAGEIGRAVLGLAREGRRREVRALLDAYVRVRTPEEAARSAEPDPQTLVPLLLEAAQGVSAERHWDLVHALRVAGLTT
ncbi:hypothetical protein [Streptomyces sp. TRM70350]|uniref:hypothetical protein n=1 Tax=Streptomyces sp. TRM70350 TaxID=2856165 RepID=UPI001C47BE19|nr:hypothetical protein [Streptomyces sp. TRM70350]MBV7694108.1 hypothetical protein [Streptomyces sp. TRM70350]